MARFTVFFYRRFVLPDLRSFSFRLPLGFYLYGFVLGEVIFLCGFLGTVLRIFTVFDRSFDDLLLDERDEPNNDFAMRLKSSMLFSPSINSCEATPTRSIILPPSNCSMSRENLIDAAVTMILSKGASSGPFRPYGKPNIVIAKIFQAFFAVRRGSQ